jgi:hypothetical protein
VDLAEAALRVGLMEVEVVVVVEAEATAFAVWDLAAKYLERFGGRAEERESALITAIVEITIAIGRTVTIETSVSV